MRNPTTQGVDGVQELRLYGVEERVEHVVFKRKLQGQKQQKNPISSDPRVLSSLDILKEHFKDIYKLRLQGQGEEEAFGVNHKL